MNITLKLTTTQDAHIIKNMWPLYQHDVSEFDHAKPNRHGLFGVGDEVKTLAQHSETLNTWWSDPAALFPYLILADGQPAGFNLVAGQPHFSNEIPADFVIHEFFILHAYRGAKIAETAATDAFDLHRGRWEVVTYPNHPRGIAFWRKTISRHTSASFTESEIDHPWGRRVVFRFANTPAEKSPS
jgi:predicted acetyltransferase